MDRDTAKLVTLIHSRDAQQGPLGERYKLAFERLLKAKADINVLEEFEDGKPLETALHFAVRTKDKPLLDFLLSKGADVNCVDEQFKTAIEVLAEQIKQILAEKKRQAEKSNYALIMESFSSREQNGTQNDYNPEHVSASLPTSREQKGIQTNESEYDPALIMKSLLKYRGLFNRKKFEEQLEQLKQYCTLNEESETFEKRLNNHENTVFFASKLAGVEVGSLWKENENALIYAVQARNTIIVKHGPRKTIGKPITYNNQQLTRAEISIYDAWEAIDFLSLRIHLFLEILLEKISKEKEAAWASFLKKEVLILVEALRVLRDCLAIDSFPIEHRAGLYRTLASSIFEKVKMLNINETYAFPIGWKGHVMYLNFDRNKEGAIYVRVDNLGELAHEEHKQYSDGSIEYYPKLIGIIDPETLAGEEETKIQEYLAQVLQTKMEETDVQKARYNIYHLAKNVLSQDESLREEVLYKAKITQKVNNCVYYSQTIGVELRIINFDLNLEDLLVDETRYLAQKENPTSYLPSTNITSFWRKGAAEFKTADEDLSDFSDAEIFLFDYVHKISRGADDFFFLRTNTMEVLLRGLINSVERIQGLIEISSNSDDKRLFIEEQKQKVDCLERKKLELQAPVEPNNPNNDKLIDDLAQIGILIHLIWSNVGDIEKKEGKLGAAKACYLKSFEAIKDAQASNQEIRATIYYRRALAQHKLKNFDQSYNLLLNAKELAKGIGKGESWLISRINLALGFIELEQNHLKESWDYFDSNSMETKKLLPVDQDLPHTCDLSMLAAYGKGLVHLRSAMKPKRRFTCVDSDIREAKKNFEKFLHGQQPSWAWSIAHSHLLELKEYSEKLEANHVAAKSIP